MLSLTEAQKEELGAASGLAARPQPGQDVAASLQAEIARCGSLDNAIAQLAHDACGAEWGSPVHDIYRAALAGRSRQRQAAETLDERCFRLGMEAADFDRRAEDQLAEAAQDDLVVKVRRERFGANEQTAANIAVRATAARSLAAQHASEAERLRSQAAAIRRSQSYAADVLAALHAAQ